MLQNKRFFFKNLKVMGQLDHFRTQWDKLQNIRMSKKGGVERLNQMISV